MSFIKMDNGNIARSAKCIEPNEDAASERFHVDRIDTSNGDLCHGGGCANRHVPGTHPDADSSGQIQFSSPGRAVHWASADPDDWERRGLSDLFYGCGSKELQWRAGTERAGGQALD